MKFNSKGLQASYSNTTYGKHYTTLTYETRCHPNWT